MRELLVIYEDGALEDCEVTRRLLGDERNAAFVRINPGFRFDIVALPIARRTQPLLYEDGAVEDEDRLLDELTKPVAMLKVNPGFRFEVLEL